MVDLPILFSAPMVRALIAGTKTQTRRILNLKPSAPILDFVKVATDKRGRSVYEMKGAGGITVSLPAGKHFQTPHFIAPFAVGDRLYVREHWRTTKVIDAVAPRDLKSTETFDVPYTPIRFEADGLTVDYHPHDDPPFGKHRQAMHMPRWASRITLIVEDVRIERLRDISREDAIAEGLHEKPWASERAVKMGCNWGYDGNDMYGSPVSAYAFLWNEINGIGAWDANPWVIAYTFPRIMANIDHLPVAT